MWVMQDYKPKASDWLSSYWKGFMSPDQMARIRNTGVPMDFLKEVGNPAQWEKEPFYRHGCRASTSMCNSIQFISIQCSHTVLCKSVCIVWVQNCTGRVHLSLKYATWLCCLVGQGLQPIYALP